MKAATPTAAWLEGLNSGCVYDQVKSRHLIRRNVAFCVSGYSVVSNVENLTAAEATKVVESYCLSEGSYFCLVGGEFLKQVSYAVAGERVRAIRFTTNLRMSQWFGRLLGTVIQLKAPDDGCINSLICGRKLENDRDCSSIAAVVWQLQPSPVASVSTTLHDVRDVCVLKSAEESGHKKAFHSATGDIKAISILSGYSVCDVGVYSESEYNQLVEFQDKLPLPGNERIVEILPNERIIGVDCRSSTGHVFLRIRLVTTLRTTTWFGSTALPDGSESAKVSYRCDADEFICGFFASPSDSISFGVVVAKHLSPVEKAE